MQKKCYLNTQGIKTCGLCEVEA